MIDLSVIIVNYNGGKLLKDCLISLVEAIDGRLLYEIIVVDNDSSDDSLSQLPVSENISLVRNSDNLGFAKANNIGFDLSKGKVVHFLNPDTKIEPTLVEDYRNILAEGRRKLFYNRIVDENGAVAKTNQMVFLLENYFNRIFMPSKVAYWNTGASIIMYRQTFIEIGRWDERYFMYAEDMDLFYSAWRKGLETEYLSAAIYHYSGGCSEKIWTNKERQKKVDHSFKLFLKKYNRAWQYPLIKMLQAIYKLLV